MNEKAATDAPGRSGLARVRRGALWLLFATVLLIPKTIALRRRPRAWNMLRVTVALVGAACVFAGIATALENGRFGPRAVPSIIIGILLAMLSLVVAPKGAQLTTGIPPLNFAEDRDANQGIAGDAVVLDRQTGAAHNASPDAIDARSRALGAYVVVDGGRYSNAEGVATAALLFVGPQHLWVLDRGLRAIIVIPVGRIARVLAEAAGEDWKVRIAWESSNTEFLYRGSFAEHLARVAEMTINSQLRRELPILR